MLESEVQTGGPYVGDGVEDTFTYPFKIFLPAHLKVTHYALDDTATPLVYGAGSGRGFTNITGVGLTGGGTFQYTIDGVVSPLPDGETLYVEWDAEFFQNTDFRRLGAWTPQSHEDAFDFLTQQTQWLKRNYDALAEAVDEVLGSIDDPLITGELTSGRIPLATGAGTLGDSLMSQAGGTIAVGGTLNINGALLMGTATSIALSSSRITVASSGYTGVTVTGAPGNLDEIIGGANGQWLYITPSGGTLTIRHNIAPTGGGSAITTFDGLNYPIDSGEIATLFRTSLGSWVLISPTRPGVLDFTTLATTGGSNGDVLMLVGGVPAWDPIRSVLLNDGSIGSPSLAGVNYTSTGRSWAAGPLMRDSVGGTQVVEYSPSVVRMNVPLDASAGARLSNFAGVAISSSRITITDAITGVVVTGGTSNLDEIIGGEDGQIILVRPFSGVLTLRHNIVPTGGGRRLYTYDGANYELEQNESALMVRDVTGWQVISPTSATASGSVPAGSIEPGTEGQVLATVGGVTAWATILGLNGQDGSAAAPTFSWASDTNSGLYSAAADAPAMAAGGVERQRWTATETVINDGGVDHNFRVETEDVTDALYMDGAGTGFFEINIPATVDALLTVTAGLNASGALNWNAANANVDASFGTAGTDTAWHIDANGAAAGGGQLNANVPLVLSSGIRMTAGASIALSSSRITVTDLNLGVSVTGGTGNLDEIIGGAPGQWLYVSPASGTLTIRHNIAPTGGGSAINTFDGLNYEIDTSDLATLFRTSLGTWILVSPARTAAGSFTNLTATGTVNFSGATVSNLGTVTTADINGGTIDGTAIGASSRSTALFTTLGANGAVTLDGGAFAWNGSQANLDFTLSSDTVAQAFFLDGNGGDESLGEINVGVALHAAAGFALGGNGGDTTKAISSSRITVEENVGYAIVTGGAVNLDEIIGGRDEQLLILTPFSGTTMTIRHNIAPTGGGLRIRTFGGNNYVVSVDEMALLWRTASSWLLITPTTGTT